MKKLLLTFFAVTSFAYATGMQQQNLTGEQMAAQNTKICELAAKELSKKLPQTIDKYTQFVSAKANGTTLEYIFEINTGAKSDQAVQKEDHSRMQNAVTNGVCQSSKRFFDAQIDISYIYKSAKSKVKLFQFDISKQTCLDLFKQQKKYY
ncbi:MAG: hypothetical protein ISR68_01200 [Campylobacterales bacterium]|nr:hypothetical protein [Campylobacterales bacterium]